MTVRNCSLLQRIRNESRVHPATSPMDNLSALPDVNWRGVGSLSFTPTVCYRGEERVEPNLHFHTCIHSVHKNCIALFPYCLPPVVPYDMVFNLNNFSLFAQKYYVVLLYKTIIITYKYSACYSCVQFRTVVALQLIYGA